MLALLLHVAILHNAAVAVSATTTIRADDLAAKYYGGWNNFNADNNVGPLLSGDGDIAGGGGLNNIWGEEEEEETTANHRPRRRRHHSKRMTSQQQPRRQQMRRWHLVGSSRHVGRGGSSSSSSSSNQDGGNDATRQSGGGSDGGRRRGIREAVVGGASDICNINHGEDYDGDADAASGDDDLANEYFIAAGDASLVLRGGGGNGLNARIINNDNNSMATTSLWSQPRTLAALSMATCMSLHYLAYSLARPATMTLFTSSRLGFGGGGGVSSAYPLAMTFIGPASFVLLLLYGRALDAGGPYFALRFTTLGCATVLGLSAMAIARLDATIPLELGGGGDNFAAVVTASKMTRCIVGALFVFRESYVQLLTSQHWSFISSILTPNESSRWFAPISGLTSVTSALAAAGVGKMSALVGLQGVLLIAAVVLGGSVVFGRMAYSIAETNGFNPAAEHNDRKKKSSNSCKLLLRRRTPHRRTAAATANTAFSPRPGTSSRASPPSGPSSARYSPARAYRHCSTYAVSHEYPRRCQMTPNVPDGWENSSRQLMY